MDSDCPLAFHHKKREYIWGVLCRGDFFFMGSFYVLELVELFRLYLGASLCIYILFWLLMYFLIGGDTFFFICFLFHFLLIYIYELFMIYVFALCFVKSRIYFCFTYIFHTCVYAFVKYFRKYIGWFSCAAVYSCNW